MYEEGVNAALVGLFVMLMLHAAQSKKSRTTQGLLRGSSIPGVGWTIKGWSELTREELYGILKLRSEVFVVEQKCVFLDIDGGDYKAHHLFATLGDQIVACTRLFGVDEVYPGGYQAMGRVCTHPSVRKMGIGRELVGLGLAECERLYGNGPVKIGAQLYLKRFYESFGFEASGPTYLEDDIEHVPMVRAKGSAKIVKEMNTYTQMFSQHPVMSAKQIMAELAEKKIILIDVRSEAEMRVSMIPGSISREEFEKSLVWQDHRLDSKSVVPICTIGFRSGQYCNKLVNHMSFPARLVKNGCGVLLWTYAPGSTLVTSSPEKIESNDGSGGLSQPQPTKKLHTFGAQWSDCGPGFEATYFGPLELAWRGFLAYFFGQ